MNRNIKSQASSIGMPIGTSPQISGGIAQYPPSPPSLQQHSSSHNNSNNTNANSSNNNMKEQVATKGQWKWTVEEDNIIREYIAQYRAHQGESAAIPYVTIAKLLPKRNQKHVRERWTNQLDPSIDRSPWTAREDKLLLDINRDKTNKWADFARKYFRNESGQVRSGNDLKNRYHKITKGWLKNQNLKNTIKKKVATKVQRNLQIYNDQEIGAICGWMAAGCGTRSGSSLNETTQLSNSNGGSQHQQLHSKSSTTAVNSTSGGYLKGASTFKSAGEISSSPATMSPQTLLNSNNRRPRDTPNDVELVAMSLARSHKRSKLEQDAEILRSVERQLSASSTNSTNSIPILYNMNSDDNNGKVKIIKMTSNAKLTEGNGIIDIYPAENSTVRGFEYSCIKTDISIDVPSEYFGILLPSNDFLLHGPTYVHGRSEDLKIYIFNQKDSTAEISMEKPIARLIIQDKITKDQKYDIVCAESVQKFMGNAETLTNVVQRVTSAQKQKLQPFEQRRFA